MEGFGEEAKDGNPFDAGFGGGEEVVAAAATGFDAFGNPEVVAAEAAFAPPPPAAEAGFAAFGDAPAAPPAGGSFGGGAPLDDGLFGGAEAEASNGGAAPAPEAVFAPPQFDDPRIEWDHKNQAVLAKRAQDEVKGKSEILAKAKAFLDKQAKERATLLDKRKATNRELERSSNVAAGAVPSGDKPWERVLSVITFNREDAKGPHVAKDTFKELSRFKGVLLTAKANNVPVNA